MGSTTLVLVIIAIVVAFWTGSRWRHHARTWADHKGAKVATKDLRKLRWVTLKGALVAIGVTFLVLLGTGAITVASPDAGHKPATVTPSVHKSSPPARHKS